MAAAAGRRGVCRVLQGPSGTAGASLVAAAGLAFVVDHRRVRAESALASASSSDAQPSFREKIMGSYEDRIRNFSSPERVFEFFASVNREDGSFMTPADFARAITPYQHVPNVEIGSKNFKYNFQAINMGPNEQEKAQYKAVLKAALADSRITPDECQEMLAARKSLNISSEVHLEVLGELGITNTHLEELMAAKGDIPRSKFFAMVDMDGDGLISYQEYMLFHTLLSIPQNRLKIAFRMFDRDDSGHIELDEFRDFMTVLRASTNAGKKEVGRLHRAKDLGLYEVFFGHDGMGTLSLADFTSFVQGLRQECYRLQFQQWDFDGSGTLTGDEFLKFLVTKVNVDRKLHAEYLKKAHSPAAAALAVKVTLEDFVAFHEFLQHLPELKVAMEVGGSSPGTGLTRPEFLKAARAAVRASRGEEGEATPGLSDSIAEALFALFDVDGDGLLHQGEFITVMETATSSLDPPRELGVLQLLERIVECAKNEIM